MLAAVAFIEDEEQDELQIRLDQYHLKRLLRNVSNVFSMGDESFRKHYRMYPETAIELINLLQPHLKNHPRGVRLHLQVLAVLRFLTEGSYQKGASQVLNHPMSQSTFSKYLHAVISEINHLANQYIIFPRNTEERRAVQARFEAKLGFPGVIGAIDCTLPKIHTPVDTTVHNQRSVCVE